jgi:LUD domain
MIDLQTSTNRNNPSNRTPNNQALCQDNVREKAMTTIQEYNALLAQKVIKEFNNRNILGFYVATKEEALKKALEITPKGSVVSWGGSATLNEIGLPDSLKRGGYTVVDASDRSKGAVEMAKIAHQALNCDYYFLSANAIAASGELVNIDGIGNRVAALAFGPRNVIVIAGINKVEQNLDSAILRAKTRAAGLVTLHYSKNDVSTFEDLLHKAQSAGSQLVITTMSTFKNRITVILVGECLGF